MDRLDVIQDVIDRTNARNYLELGVFDGLNFFRVAAPRKVAVDPVFAFSARDRLRWVLKNRSNLRASYHQTTSDDFFANVARPENFDVIFIDGLHTYAQALRDVTNALHRLSRRGIIVMHDCNPPHVAAALPAPSIDDARAAGVPGWTNEWCGDVWKAVCHLRSQRDDLQVFVLDCDYGVGIVRVGVPESRPELTVTDIGRMSYEDLDANRLTLLNLKPIDYWSNFMATL